MPTLPCPPLQAATELCWLACACSRLNGEELTRAGGLRLLSRLLSRCVAVMPRDVPAHDPAAAIATHTLRALAVMAAFENARAELQGPGARQLLADIVLCCSLQRAPAAAEAALLCLARCCASGALQATLLELGMLPHVVPLLLSFDATHADAADASAAAPLPPADDATAVLRLPLLRANMQATKNLQAQLAVRALAALAGYPPRGSSAPADGEAAAAAQPAALAPAAPAAATPPCPPAQQALAGLLTEALAPRLADADPLPLLRDLNSTVQTPQVCCVVCGWVGETWQQRCTMCVHTQGCFSYCFASLASQSVPPAGDLEQRNARRAAGASGGAALLAWQPRGCPTHLHRRRR